MRQSLLRATAITVLVVLSGCEMLLWPAASGSLYTSGEFGTSAVALNEIAALLDHDSWSVEAEWSPILEPGSPFDAFRTTPPLRHWSHRAVLKNSRLQGDSHARIDTIVAAHLDKGGLLSAPAQYLSTIARRNDLAGWNAAILLAQRDHSAGWAPWRGVLSWFSSA